MGAYCLISLSPLCFDRKSIDIPLATCYILYDCGRELHADNFAGKLPVFERSCDGVPDIHTLAIT